MRATSQPGAQSIRKMIAISPRGAILAEILLDFVNDVPVELLLRPDSNPKLNSLVRLAEWRLPWKIMIDGSPEIILLAEDHDPSVPNALDVLAQQPGRHG